MRDAVLRKLRLWVNVNGWKALVAFGMACMIHIGIKPKLQVYSATLPIELEKADKTVVYAIKPAQTLVTFHGSESEIAAIKGVAGLKLVVRAGSQGVQRTKLSRRNASVPGVKRPRIGDIAVKEIEVMPSVLGELNFKVAEPSQQGKPFRGIAEVNYTPKTVKIKGDVQRLARIRDAGVMLSLEPVDMAGRASDFVCEAKVLPLDGYPEAEITPDRVKVEVVIKRDHFSLELADVPVRLVFPSGSGDMCAYTAEPVTVKVSLAGDDESLTSMRESDIRAYAEPIGALAAGTNKAAVRVWAPERFKVGSIRVVPATVSMIAPPLTPDADAPSSGTEIPPSGTDASSSGTEAPPPGTDAPPFDVDAPGAVPNAPANTGDGAKDTL